MQWRGLSQRLQFLGIEWGRRGWGQPCTYPLHRDLQPTLVPSDHRNSPSPDTERLAALATQSSKRQHPSQRGRLYMKAVSSYCGPMSESH